uniref:Uncharacterized protein n=1 Tax=Anguilla anguilla TaxID=7936 RepID=A0A0E9WK07_ANGAN
MTVADAAVPASVHSGDHTFTFYSVQRSNTEANMPFSLTLKPLVLP